MRSGSTKLLVIALATACQDKPTGVSPPDALLLDAIGAGYYTTCGLAQNGGAYCWGDGARGQLGVAPTDSQIQDCSSIPGEAPCTSTPVPVAGGGVFAAIAAGGAHVCASPVPGQPKCWGDDRLGQLGTPDTAALCGAPPAPCADTPVGVGLANVIAITAGDSHTCVLRVGGNAFCWGYGASGRLGNGGDTNTAVPVAVAGGLTFAAISAGGSFTCALGTDSVAYCWGLNHLGQLGDGTTTEHPLPAPISTSERFVQIATGSAHACAITAQGAGFCWGANIDGELGTTFPVGLCGGVSCGTQPVPVAGQHLLTAFALGGGFTCAMSGSNSYCWGAIPGTGPPFPTIPVMFGTGGQVSGTPFVSMTAGADHACGIVATHEAYCWGSDYHGKLGDGPADGSGSRPVLVVAPDSTRP